MWSIKNDMTLLESTVFVVIVDVVVIVNVIVQAQIIVADSIIFSCGQLTFIWGY